MVHLRPSQLPNLIPANISRLHSPNLTIHIQTDTGKNTSTKIVCRQTVSNAESAGRVVAGIFGKGRQRPMHYRTKNINVVGVHVHM